MTQSMFLNFARSIFSQVLSVYVESPYLESPVAIGSRKASINCKPENFVPNTGSKIEHGHMLPLDVTSAYKEKENHKQFWLNGVSHC